MIIHQSYGTTLLFLRETIKLAKTKIDGELVEVDFDEVDGRYVFDMEFKTANGEEEISIDSETIEFLQNDDH